VEVNPLPRSQPLQSQQFPPRQQVSTTTPTPPEPEDPFANRAVPQQSPPPTAAAEPPTAPAEQPAAELSQGSGPVVALLDNARSHVDNKDWDKAAASLERALRIEPRNATIWHDLAQIRLQQRDYQQAETLAQKSNSLAGSNRGVQARNWDLIAFSRRAQGNNSGADEAEAQATVLRR
jgi:predicted Zn-dependent protease